MKKHHFWLVGFLFLVSLFSGINYSRAAGEADAIGVRIIPNPNHYSISRWYASQGFSGSPQSLLVDGYEAIRDGRTVYVNAANIDRTGKTIYTNIYLISYNQDSAAKTVDILGQIVSHWKFNSNLEDPFVTELQPNTCSISSLSCTSDSDCAASQFCATSTPVLNSCVLKNVKSCQSDMDCPTNFFCDSLKAKVARDVRRVGKIEELKESLAQFRNAKGRYPKLDAGSYLTNRTVSVWPSWSQELLTGLSVGQNFFDPINRLGACAGFDQKTCWNKDTKKFVNDPEPNLLRLPANSYAMVYNTDTNGANYSLCAVIESRDPNLNYHFSPNDPASSACVTGTGTNSSGQSINHTPILIEKTLLGVAGQEFNGSIKVVDPDNDPLTWQLNTSATNWTGWKNNNLANQAPLLKATGNSNQKKVYAQKAGGPGDYPMVLTVSDGRGLPNSAFSTTTIIKISNEVPLIEAEDVSYTLDPLYPLIYEFSFSGRGFNVASTSYTVVKTAGPAGIDILNNSGMTRSFSSVGLNKYKISYSGQVMAASQLHQDADFTYQIAVNDNYSSANKKFTIHIISEKPVLDLNCPLTARLNRLYSCRIGSTKQGNHTLYYSSGDLPEGLSLDFINNNNQVSVAPEPQKIFSLSRLWNIMTRIKAALGQVITPAPVSTVYLQGYPTATSSGFVIDIQANNEYDATATKSFSLKINNYCGDGVKQAPNLEGRGGIYNDGYEDCDGLSGTTIDPSLSSLNLQYGCATGINIETPYVIPNNKYCVFRGPLEGGGFCGDDICQDLILTSFGTTTLETTTNCPEDCGPANTTSCTPDCEGKKCGPDGCNGYCPPGCEPGATCTNFGFECGNGSCGNGLCDNGENCGGCPGDCGQCTGVCGDTHCDNTTTENCGNCVSDCACTGGKICVGNQCIDNTSSCTCEGRQCGPNSCNQGGASACGTCSGGTSCTSNGHCCLSNCQGCQGVLGNINWNPCGGSCCNLSTEHCCANGGNPQCRPLGQACNNVNGSGSN